MESLKKFIPNDKLWPINEYWYFHAGANGGNNTLASVQKAVDKRYGPSSSAEEFSKKAQLANYENVRAQFENYSANGWANHKMMVYWMLDNHWPSFFGHLFDYYYKQGGGYFGAKKGLKPLSVVYDYYATGDRSKANIYVANQTLQERHHMKVSIALYSLDGTQKFAKEVKDFTVGANTSATAMSIGRVEDLSSAFFVRCQLRDEKDALVADNLYWQSTSDDDLGNTKNDDQFALTQTKWADLSALNNMPQADVTVSGKLSTRGGEATANITITNNSEHVAFFMRVEVTKGSDAEELLPITYEDNYITLFPNESRTVQANFRSTELAGQSAALRLVGYNVAKKVEPMGLP